MASKTDSIIKLVLVFFISLLSFAVGPYVGKKYSDRQHDMAKLEPHGNKVAHENTDEQHSESGEVAQGEESASHEEGGGSAHSEASANGEEKSNRDIASVKKAEHPIIKGDESDNMSDEEIAKLAEEFVRDDIRVEEPHKEKDAHGKKIEKTTEVKSHSEGKNEGFHQADIENKKP